MPCFKICTNACTLGPLYCDTLYMLSGQWQMFFCFLWNLLWTFYILHSTCCLRLYLFQIKIKHDANTEAIRSPSQMPCFKICTNACTLGPLYCDTLYMLSGQWQMFFCFLWNLLWTFYILHSTCCLRLYLFQIKIKHDANTEAIRSPSQMPSFKICKNACTLWLLYCDTLYMLPGQRQMFFCFLWNLLWTFYFNVEGLSCKVYEV